MPGRGSNPDKQTQEAAKALVKEIEKRVRKKTRVSRTKIQPNSSAQAPMAPRAALNPSRLNPLRPSPSRLRPASTSPRRASRYG